MLMLAFCMNAIAAPPPVVTWNTALLVQPITSTTFLLTGGLPEGGTYSGPGVTGTNFNASIVGPGTHTLYYTFTDSTGASATASNTITVFALPVVVFSGTLSDQCVSSTTYTLTGGSPAGGTYSGPGVTGTNFDASIAGVGSHTLVYSITNSYGYVSSSSNSIIVHELPVANAGPGFPIIPGAYATLSGSASAGTGSYAYAWTPADSLLPGNSSLAAPTTINLYTTNTFSLIVTDLITGCQSIPDSVLVFFIWGGPLVANATVDDNEICVGTQVTLGATTTGGSGIYTYFWTSTPPGFFSTSPSPSVSPSVTTTYTVAVNDGFVTTTSSVIITVHPLPPVIFSTVLTPQCVSSTVYYLSGGSPAGGTYSGPGVTGFWIINPNLLGVGVHPLAYTYTDANGCTNTAATTLIVNPLPIVTWSVSLNPQYTNATTYPLTGGLPLGGTYTGPGVSVNNFNAAIAGPGIHTLTYSYKDANNCSNSVTNSILTLLPPDTLSDLSGVLSYANTASTKLENAIIQLTKNGTWIAETLTNANGEYQFTDLQPGTYMLKAIVNQPGGGGNAVDALLIMKHFVGMTTLASPWLEACDVDASSFVNATDGLEVMKRFVGIVNSYPSGDWYSETAVVSLIGGTNFTQNLKAICFGDADASFEP